MVVGVVVAGESPAVVVEPPGAAVVVVSVFTVVMTESEGPVAAEVLEDGRAASVVDGPETVVAVVGAVESVSPPPPQPPSARTTTSMRTALRKGTKRCRFAVTCMMLPIECVNCPATCMI